MNVVIAPHGVPDEPWHIDTAYKYSNKIMFAGNTGIEGTIYKRTCDVKMEDMLANGVESNSYYQLAHHTFERPDDQELIAVPYVDSSNIVPGIFFIPMAFGITTAWTFNHANVIDRKIYEPVGICIIDRIRHTDTSGWEEYACCAWFSSDRASTGGICVL